MRKLFQKRRLCVNLNLDCFSLRSATKLYRDYSTRVKEIISANLGGVPLADVARERRLSVVALFPCARRSSSELRCLIKPVHQFEFVWCAGAGRCLLIGHAYHRLHVVQDHGSDVLSLVVIEIMGRSLAPF
jgi:hypothetical protein